MKACTCSMGSLQVQSAVASSSSAQLKSARGGAVLGERLDSTVITLRCACQSNYVDNRVRRVQSFPFNKAEASSRLWKDCNKQSGLTVGLSKLSANLCRKPVMEVQARIQETMDYDTSERGTDYADRRTRTRDRNIKQPVGERRRQVQVVSDNGMVDLDKQLGLVDDDGMRSVNKRRGSSHGRGIQISSSNDDEDGRRLLESRFSRDGADEMSRRQECRTDTCTKAESSSELDSFPGSERSELYPGSRPSVTSEGCSECAIEVEVAENNGGTAWFKTGVQGPRSLAELPGGRRVVELVAAWDGLAGRLPPEFSRSSGSDILLRALKLTVMALQRTTPDEDGRTPLCRALAVAHTLADLGMDAEVISAGLLRDVVDAKLVSYALIEETLGRAIPALLHDCSRVRHIPSRVETLDDDNSTALRQFCLTFHDIRAIVVELANRLDTMRHIHSLPRYRQQILALETMQIYAPLAHAIGTGSMSLELEDLGFRVLFPDSYSYIEYWLRSHWVDGSAVVDKCREQLSAALDSDAQLQDLIKSVTVAGRYKSRFSTMRKLLKDGRKPEEVFDVLGLRVILEPKAGGTATEQSERGARSCYRAMEIATSIWNEVPGRLKDYIAKPKLNGYESLHLAVHLCDQSEWRPPMEIQIRTTEMDAVAVAGQASHSLYKGGLTDPEQVKNLKIIMVAAANVAASRFGEIARNAVGLEGGDPTHDENDQIFKMFDKNQDGVISVDEFREVIQELGADREDALELMQIVDLNTDGSVTADEFNKFRHQIQISQNLAGVDREFSSQLGSKLQQKSFETGAELAICAKKEEPGCSKNVELILQNSAESDITTLDPGKSSKLVEPEADTMVRSSVLTSLGDSELIGTLQVDTPSSSATVSYSHKTRAHPGKQKPSLVKPVRMTKNLAGLNLSKDPVVWSELQKEIPKWSRITKGTVLEDLKVPISEDEAPMEGIIKNELAKFRHLMAVGDMLAARKLIIELSMEYPANTKVLLHGASLERKSGSLVAAASLYAQAIREFKLRGDFNTEYVRALQAWGSLEAQGQNARKARQLFMESLHASQKGDPQSSLYSAGVYGLHGWATLEERLGNWSKARVLLQRAAELQPGNALVHQSRARLEARGHNYAAARMHFKLAVEAAPEDPICWHAWAMFEASQGKWGKMRQLFAQALELDPKNVHSMQAWAHQEGLIGTDESRARAKGLYQKCADVSPENVHCWQSWAILEQECANFSGARILFEKGLSANPESVPCLQAYAHMERKCGNLTSARNLLLAALALDSENAPALMELAIVEDKLGNTEVAQKLYQEAAKIDKKKSRVKRRIFESRKAELQTSGSRPKSKVLEMALRNKSEPDEKNDEVSTTVDGETIAYDDTLSSVALSTRSDR